ncbi:hypothetical protein SAMD00019534_000580 [Acytostelium subglobosum LB1]|uniref:hypothetical protein n=1 Tax=Acytostelium subglobosum LB1 TaxID=1410327 RepID=UPI000644B9C3|nr:hypothetical protein SAMD00019534_000580 [Acytostelium subglobosum LB1]GAM16883.1 hypothetical protein SAMD00019534_000580 [Acytostelium subglobosum LB1]|eukprot:XP_012758945.1 hypothetical protein SAMD00019534_000580 [Acytostelium subglobosum LB1]
MYCNTTTSTTTTSNNNNNNNIADQFDIISSTSTTTTQASQSPNIIYSGQLALCVLSKDSKESNHINHDLFVDKRVVLVSPNILYYSNINSLECRDNLVLYGSSVEPFQTDGADGEILVFDVIESATCLLQSGAAAPRVFRFKALDLTDFNAWLDLLRLYAQQPDHCKQTSKSLPPLKRAANEHHHRNFNQSAPAATQVIYAGESVDTPTITPRPPRDWDEDEVYLIEMFPQLEVSVILDAIDFCGNDRDEVIALLAAGIRLSFQGDLNTFSPIDLGHSLHNYQPVGNNGVGGGRTPNTESKLYHYQQYRNKNNNNNTSREVSNNSSLSNCTNTNTNNTNTNTNNNLDNNSTPTSFSYSPMAGGSIGYYGSSDNKSFLTFPSVKVEFGQQLLPSPPTTTTAPHTSSNLPSSSSSSNTNNSVPTLSLPPASQSRPIQCNIPKSKIHLSIRKRSPSKQHQHHHHQHQQQQQTQHQTQTMDNIVNNIQTTTTTASPPPTQPAQVPASMVIFSNINGWRPSTKTGPAWDLSISITGCCNLRTHTEYKIQVKTSFAEWTVFRRYNNFLLLDKKLRRVSSVDRKLLLVLPSKKLLSFSNEVIRSRQVSLQTYLTTLLQSHPGLFYSESIVNLFFNGDFTSDMFTVSAQQL